MIWTRGRIVDVRFRASLILEDEQRLAHSVARVARRSVVANHGQDQEVSLQDPRPEEPK